MDFDSLYYFQELAKDLHMTRTANRLFISQQTLSNHILRLEKYYGTPLFYRKPKLALTSAGELVLNFAKLTAKEHNNLKDILSDLAEQERSLLRIGASLPRAIFFMPKILPEFYKRYPNVDVRFIEAVSSELEPMVINEKLNFAVILTGEPYDSLISHHLLCDQVYLCVSDHLLKKHYGEQTAALKEKARHGASVEDFSRLPFCMTTNRLGDAIQHCFEAAGCKPNVYFTVTYSHLMIPFCVQSLSACFMTQMSLWGLWEQLPDDINVFPLNFQNEPMVQKLSLIRLKERHLSAFAKGFLEILFHFFSDIQHTQTTRIVPEQ